MNNNVIDGKFPSRENEGHGYIVEGSFYTITVTYAMTDPLTGEWQYRATVAEFPDIEVWAYHASQVYWLAVHAVERTIGMALDNGDDYPLCERFKSSM